ncbi:MAG: TIGR01777 family protein [Bacteroidetes bacterium HGW-Bacteroidetes-21]|jgi:hypothetical protein|nr:MAG: TIGR01777 family protein [Bacteroidetes bacterium HGW-Bacteroidetes-21]
MKIALAGISGFIGSYIAQYLTDKGHEIVPITREDFKLHNISFIITGCDAVINFTGHPILCRWTNANKTKIFESRIETTSELVNSMSVINDPPKILINASAIGIYSPDVINYENQYKQADNFLAEIVEAWESEVTKAIYADIRTIIMRLGVVIDKNGGIIKKLRPLFKMGLGGRLGNGKQKMSFIHIQDLVRAIEYFLTNPNASDVYNLTTPFPVTNKEFTKKLAAGFRKKAFFRIPACWLRLIYGKSSLLILESSEVYPDKLLKEGFTFHYPKMDDCIDQVCHH